MTIKHTHVHLSRRRTDASFGCALKQSNSKKTLVCVCYRPNSPGLKRVVRVVYEIS